MAGPAGVRERGTGSAGMAGTAKANPASKTHVSNRILAATLHERLLGERKNNRQDSGPLHA